MSYRGGMLKDMYREDTARLTPRAVLWSATPRPDSVGRVLPDGCMDLLWSGEELLVAGPDTTAYMAPASRSTWYGLRFAPGHAAGVLGVPANRLRDQRVPLDVLWSASRVHRWHDAIAGAACPTAVLDHIAVSMSPLRPDPRMDAVVAAARRTESAAAIAQEVNLSQRQLRRRCLEVFGYGFKTLQRVLRMNRALDQVRAGAPLAVAATACGYADQAHFARETRALAGAPVSQLMG